MQNNVSIRNIPVLITNSEARSFNSKANRAGSAHRLLPLWPREREDRSLRGRENLIAAIERALRKERRYGRAGHPAYDLERHAYLCRMLKDERAEAAMLSSRVHQTLRRSQK